MTDTQLARFIAKVDHFGESGVCWLWRGLCVQGGYGRMTVAQRPTQSKLAHRLAYEHWVGPIPDGLEIDHVCRVRSCVNVAHLEAVTHLENIRRGEAGKGARAAQQFLRDQTHCRNGHSYDDAYASKGARRCRQCHSAVMKRWYQKRKREVA